MYIIIAKYININTLNKYITWKWLSWVKCYCKEMNSVIFNYMNFLFKSSACFFHIYVGFTRRLNGAGMEVVVFPSCVFSRTSVRNLQMTWAPVSFCANSNCDFHLTTFMNSMSIHRLGASYCLFSQEIASGSYILLILSINICRLQTWSHSIVNLFIFTYNVYLMVTWFAVLQLDMWHLV